MMSVHVPCAMTLLVVASLLRSGGGTVISSSKLERCVLDGVKDAEVAVENLSCEQKLVVTIAVEGGHELETEHLQFNLACLGSSTCPCPCDYAAEADCNCRDLNQTLTVALTKSPVYAAYPLTYVKAFNSKPKEVVHSGLSSCDDGDFDDSPTCGWYLVAGERVSDSQGFCCECTSSQVVADTFGSLDERTRANLNCDFFDGAWDFFKSNPASAHCLFFDPLWYQGFDIGSAQIDFRIEVSFVGDEGTAAAEVLTLRPSDPHQRNRNGTVEAELLGDLAGYTELPTLSDKMLMVPFPAGSDPSTALSGNAAEWMLIEKSQISLDGTECNKVGTSFTAFRFQNDGCSRPVGTCLENQLQDRFDEDDARIVAGQTPLYRIARYSGSSSITQTARQGAGQVSLEFPVYGIRNSLLTLTAAADDLKFVLHSSPGEIIYAAVCAFNNVTCGEFESLSDRGYLHVEIRNTGYIPAEYTLTVRTTAPVFHCTDWAFQVTNCSEGVMPAQAQKATVEAQEASTLPAFFIQMTTATARENISCWVTLLSSLGEALDTQNVTFSVGQTEFEELPQNPDSREGTGVGPAPVSLSCTDYCPNIFNVFCLLVHRCWTRILICIAILLAIFISIRLCIKGVQNGWCLKCWSSGCAVLFSSASPASSESSRYDGHVRKKAAHPFQKRAWMGIPSRSTEEPAFTIPASCMTQSIQQRPFRNINTGGVIHSHGNALVYLSLAAFNPPSWLSAPGRNGCLAGTVKQIQSIPHTPPAYIFIIPQDRAYQLAAWNQEMQRYVPLCKPLPFDAALGTCLN